MDIDRRLATLRDRRKGLTKLRKSAMALDSAEAQRRALLSESYEKRSNNKATRYILGAMEQVNPEYTKNSISEGTRIASQLRSRLPTDWLMEYELQGSVPLNVHIEGVSDVDLLAIRTDYFRYDLRGPAANSYTPMTEPSAQILLWSLREKAKEELTAAYPAATVDAGSKSIRLEGGSLQRKIDVVPSMWKRTAAFQARGEKKDKGVVILDISAWTTLDNLPFLHIHEIHWKDMRTLGGTKKIIRLLKTMKEDSDDKEKIIISSYDIASLVWHIDDGLISVEAWAELQLLAVAQERFRYWSDNKSLTMSLVTPDGTRKIVDSEDKFRSLQILSLEIDRLAEAVALELEPSIGFYPNMIQNSVPATLRKSYIPG